MITVIAIVTDGLVYAAWLFVVAIGLTLIFGVMKILNVAHGAFYAFGAYAAATAIGLYFDRGWPVVGGYMAIAVAAIATGLLMGYILERVFLRRVYGKDEVVVVLITYALFLILEDVLILIWGTDGRSAYQPYTEAGSFTVGGLPLSVYDIGLVGFAGLLAIAASYAIKKTTFGRLLTAVIYDRETAAAFGVDVSAGLYGDLSGRRGAWCARRRIDSPKISVTPGLGVEVIVLAFAVVAIGGMGSMEGALVGALIVGLFRAGAVHLIPQLELFSIYAVMALVLVFRPQGLFSRAQPRKI